MESFWIEGGGGREQQEIEGRGKREGGREGGREEQEREVLLVQVYCNAVYLSREAELTCDKKYLYTINALPGAVELHHAHVQHLHG